MPETEPTPWELMRVLRQVQSGIESIQAAAVTKDAFREFQREVRETSERLGREIGDERTERARAIEISAAAQEKDLADETKAREKDVDAIHTRLDKIAANLRWVATGLLVPIALFIAARVWGGPRRPCSDHGDDGCWHGRSRCAAGLDPVAAGRRGGRACGAGAGDRRAVCCGAGGE